MFFPSWKLPFLLRTLTGSCIHVFMSPWEGFGFFVSVNFDNATEVSQLASVSVGTREVSLSMQINTYNLHTSSNWFNMCSVGKGVPQVINVECLGIKYAPTTPSY